MTRNALIGSLVFGLTAAVAGYVWTAFEFPFAIVLPAAAGWFAVVSTQYGRRKASWAALVGGVSFTVAFLVAVFFALTDGSGVSLAAWMGATLAAAVAGALGGLVFGGMRGALAMSGFSAAGMLVATLATALLRDVAPAAVDVAGPTQSAYFALVIGIVGVIVGAAIGAGVAWFKAHDTHAVEAGSSPHQPHPA